MIAVMVHMVPMPQNNIGRGLAGRDSAVSLTGVGGTV